MENSITTHNGMITIFNPQTGQHRTIRIKTRQAKEETTWRPGEDIRILGLLIGPENTSDYLQFGEVSGDKIRIWKKYQGHDGQKSFYEQVADMLLNPGKYEDRGIEYQFDTRCRVCNRPLTDPESITSGIGPVCAGR